MNYYWNYKLRWMATLSGEETLPFSHFTPFTMGINSEKKFLWPDHILEGFHHPGKHGPLCSSG